MNMTEKESHIYAYFRKKRNIEYTKEAELLSDAKVMLNMLGAVVVRQECTVRGISDLLVCYKGRFIAIELKTHRGAATTHQKQFIAAVQKAGGTAGICRNLEEIFELLFGDPE